MRCNGAAVTSSAHLPVVPELTEPFEVRFIADFLLDQVREDVSGVHIQHHQGPQSHTVLLGQFAADQGDNIINLTVAFFQVLLKSLKEKKI